MVLDCIAIKVDRPCEDRYLFMNLKIGKMMKSANFVTPTKGNPQDDEDDQQLYQNRNNGSQDTPQSGGSNDTNPNQGSPSTPHNLKVNESLPYSPDCNGTNKDRKSQPTIGELLEEGRQMFQQKWFAFFEEACVSSPCSNAHTAMEETTTLQQVGKEVDDVFPTLGISRMMAPGKENLTNSASLDAQKELRPGEQTQEVNVTSPQPSSASLQAVAEVEVSSKDQVKVTEPSSKPKPPLDPKDKAKLQQDATSKKKAPLDLLEVTSAEAVELERSISELTMRSSYGGVEQLQRLPDNRRMAYYAVGKHHRQSGRGGNRRCYFSGKLILGGAPFYAGTVQQGLRTLVVFCLPSAVGLPDKETVAQLKLQQKQRQPPVPGSLSVLKQQSGTSQNGLSYVMRDQSKSSLSARSLGKNASKGSASKRRPSGLSSIADGASSIASKSISRLSSLDDLSLSIEGDLDPNWGLDRDLLVQVLPEADKNLLNEMSNLYPEQFATLPVQVRAPARWNLYVKFCFFSGLPIAEGEMHYKVKDDIADVVYGEELDLSHDVMEAVNGEQSAEILQLPNQKVFRYLRKHYAQQCSKLDDRVFRRTAWERVAPEI